MTSQPTINEVAGCRECGEMRWHQTTCSLLKQVRVSSRVYDSERSPAPSVAVEVEGEDVQHRWEIAPHPDTDFDTLITNSDNEARTHILEIAEMHLWDSNEPGQERVMRVRMNDVPTTDSPAAPAAPAVPEPARLCVKHCEHDPEWVQDGECQFNGYDNAYPRSLGLRCGHTCEFAAPVALSIFPEQVRTEPANTSKVVLSNPAAPAMDEWRYSHDEIEYACGGETALMVREKVMARRDRINAETAIELSRRAAATPTGTEEK